MLLQTQPLCMGLHPWTCAQLTPAQWGVCQDPQALRVELVPLLQHTDTRISFPRAQAGSRLLMCQGRSPAHETDLWGTAVPTVLTWQEGVQSKWHRIKNRQGFPKFTYASHEVTGSNTVFLPWILINFTMIISCFHLQKFLSEDPIIYWYCSMYQTVFWKAKCTEDYK